MIKNYLLVSIRNILRNRVYSVINIFGLSTAITLCLLIILFVIDQRSMDGHMPDRSNTYRVLSEIWDQDKEKTRRYATSPYKLQELIKDNHPEITSTAQLYAHSDEVRFDDRIFTFKGLFASSNFMEFFHYPLVEGSPEALSNPQSIVLTEELATKLFPNESPLGQQVEMGDQGSFLVTGIVQDLPSRTHLEFDALISFPSFDRLPGAHTMKEDWVQSATLFYNYFKSDDYNEWALQGTLENVVALFPADQRGDYSFSIQPLDEVSLGKVVRSELGFVTPDFVPWFLGVLAMVVLLSATFNYVGLAIALSLKRAREIGVRKIVGAGRRQVFLQFVVEAQVTVIFSWILSLAFLSFLLPAYNELKVLRDIHGQITIDLMANLHLYGLFFLFAVLVGLLAGGYPAWYVGNLSFGRALGKEVKSKSPSFALRKTLIVVQYACSIIFIMTAIVLHRQSVHFFEMDYGFDSANLINVPLNELSYDALKTELERDSNVTGVSLTSALPGLAFMDKVDLAIPGHEEPLRMSHFSVNEDFHQNYDIRIVEGRTFDASIESDRQAVLLNRQAMEMLNLQLGASDARIKLGDSTGYQRVIGVIDDFKFELLFRESGPLVLTYASAGPRFVNIRYRSWTREEAARSIEGIWRQFDKLRPFEYTHYEFALSDMYDEFKDISRIVGLVAVIAIIIACLGQFGMILHHVQLKTKEVGIRKTMGANLGQLIYLLSANYLRLILISAVIGVPLGWWINALWTGKIVYSIGVDVTTVIVGVTLVFGLALAAIFSLTWRTANTNPVDSLRYE